MKVKDYIIKRIKKEGPISFHDFMEMALYYPGYGYYDSSSTRIGKEGDYYTSPCVTSIFGELLARQLEEMWLMLGATQFTILEYGAGPGWLCRDILHELKKNRSFYKQLNYCIIERSTAMRELEKSTLDGNISWPESIQDIGCINGCILSNELIDNFPVHIVEMDDELKEIYVDYDDKFRKIRQPAGDELKSYLTELNMELPRGFCAEINMEAVRWIKDVANNLKRGFVMTIDYGYDSEQWLHAGKRNGTILCYHKHSVNDKVFENIGQQDITSFVNFSALNHWGKLYGLECAGYCNQLEFLHALGLNSLIREKEKNNSVDYDSDPDKMQWMHSFISQMGSKIKVLIQQKGVQDHLNSMAFSHVLGA
jgi:SAM-dependent MidA family methyltransferase